MSGESDDSMILDVEKVGAHWPGIPKLVLEAMGLYFNAHVRPGNFLMACLENDLVGAFEKADPWSLEALPQIVRVLVNDTPANAWGSPMLVARWIEAGR